MLVGTHRRLPKLSWMPRHSKCTLVEQLLETALKILPCSSFLQFARLVIWNWFLDIYYGSIKTFPSGSVAAEKQSCVAIVMGQQMHWQIKWRYFVVIVMYVNWADTLLLRSLGHYFSFSIFWEIWIFFIWIIELLFLNITEPFTAQSD